MNRYRREWEEWHAVKDEMIAEGKQPTAYEVTTEWRRRLADRGERPMTYAEVVADLEEVKA